MAEQHDVNQLLSGVAGGDPYHAFGIITALSPSQLRRECRRKQAAFHQDKGNSLVVSQLANACADVLCDRVPVLAGEIVATASRLLEEVRQCADREQYTKLMQEWRDRDKQARIDRATTPENKRRALLLMSSFERVKRSEATPHADVRIAFQRAFGLTNNEAGYLMRAVGVRAAINYKRMYIAHDGEFGLRIPTNTENCTECPMCSYCWKPAGA